MALSQSEFHSLNQIFVEQKKTGKIRADGGALQGQDMLDHVGWEWRAGGGGRNRVERGRPTADGTRSHSTFIVKESTPPIAFVCSSSDKRRETTLLQLAPMP
jgi:hypothetical protein